MVSAFHLGKTGDDNVIYEFTGLTFDNLIQGDIFIGSCCFCENSNGPDRSGCVDYVNKTYCDSVGGSPTVPCLLRLRACGAGSSSSKSVNYENGTRFTPRTRALPGGKTLTLP